MDTLVYVTLLPTYPLIQHSKLHYLSKQSNVYSKSNYLFSTAHKLTKHTVKYQLEMRLEEHVSGRNILWSTLVCKSREGKINHFPHCPFELPANQHSQFGPSGLD
jgi:hypothetical protein